MYPMDFEEFLWAKGDRVTAPAIRDAAGGAGVCRWKKLQGD